MAGYHLMDEETGEYNVPFIRRYVKDRDVLLVDLVGRVQGLIVPSGNPKSLASLGDLTRDDVTLANRQRGSGTRVLLDHMLSNEGLSPDRILGYGREEYTHLAVAASVAGNQADVGLGVLSAARAMELDFVPLKTERYDLAIPVEHYESELLKPLLFLVRSGEFRKAVDSVGGYDTVDMGRVVAEIGSSGSRVMVGFSYGAHHGHAVECLRDCSGRGREPASRPQQGRRADRRRAPSGKGDRAAISNNR